jgi:DNA replication protein DnaC
MTTQAVVKTDYEAIVQKIIQENPDTMRMGLRLEPRPGQENFLRELSLLRASRIPDRHKDFQPQDSESSEWSGQWCKLAQSTGKEIIAMIYGNRGAGKTQMAVCAIKKACAEDRSALYTKAMNFFLDIRATYRKDAAVTERAMIDKYCAPELLVIDAIENRSDSPFENLLLTYLIDVRYDQMKDTILVGNFTEEQFAANMGPSVVDRIHECGIKIICKWKSFRRK